MDGGGVDHDPEDAGVEGQPRDGHQVVVGRVGGSTQVGAGCRRGVAQVGEEALGEGHRLGGRVQDDPGEVEEDTVEDDGEVGVRPGVQPQRGGPAGEVREGLRVQPRVVGRRAARRGRRGRPARWGARGRRSRR